MTPEWRRGHAIAQHQDIPVECVPDQVIAVCRDKEAGGLMLAKQETRIGRNGQAIAQLWFGLPHGARAR
jgi:hypothetical protein